MLESTGRKGVIIKKRIAAIILVVSLGISALAGCGNDAGQSQGSVSVEGNGATDADGWYIDEVKAVVEDGSILYLL